MNDSEFRQNGWSFLELAHDDYQKLMVHSPDALFIQRADKIVFLNEAAMVLFGANRPDAILGRSALEFVHPDFRESIRQRLKAVLHDRQAMQPMAQKIVRLDGTIRDVEGHSAPYPQVDQQTVLVTLRDMTPRIQAEAQLRNSEYGLRLALKVGGIGTWSQDPATGHLEWSDETYRIFGCTRETFPLTRDAFLALVHPGDRARLRESSERAIADLCPYACEHRVIRPDGVERVVFERADWVANPLGGPRWIGVVQDVTDRVRQGADVAR